MTVVGDKSHNLTGETRRDFLKGAVRTILDLRAQGDVAAILEWTAPDFVYKPLGEWSKSPALEAARRRNGGAGD